MSILKTDIFTGKAENYAKARPGYPVEAINYIESLIPVGSIVADIGAGTGKFTELIVKRGYKLYAVEPNTDMREQLSTILSPHNNTVVINGTAEATTLQSGSIDVITCAQSLHWFDHKAFRQECLRIGKENVLVIALYNETPGGSSIAHSKQSTDFFYDNPTIREFPNPIYYTRESWLQYMTSHSHDPLPGDDRYDGHITEMNAVFDNENIDGLLKRDVVTKVYSERLKAK